MLDEDDRAAKNSAFAAALAKIQEKYKNLGKPPGAVGEGVDGSGGSSDYGGGGTAKPKFEGIKDLWKTIAEGISGQNMFALGKEQLAQQKRTADAVEAMAKRDAAPAASAVVAGG